MPLRFASLVLYTIVAVGLGVAMPPPPTGNCGEKAERRTCGSACAPTCDNPTPAPICVLPCVDACFCKEGYLKAANGQCVRPQDCDSGHRIPQQIPQQMNAAADVPKKDEPPKCGENEVYSTCGSACIQTCAMPMFKPWCTLRCAVGCFCKEGYLKNEQGVCIPATRCKSLELSNDAVNIPLHKVPLQPHCPTDKEEFHNCGVQLNCLASCKMPKTPECMERRCTPGCMCRKPFVRHEDGRCVEKTQCPKTTLFDVVAQA